MDHVGLFLLQDQFKVQLELVELKILIHLNKKLLIVFKVKIMKVMDVMVELVEMV